MDLPQSFQSKMEQELGREWPSFLACYEEKPWRGYRINQRKVVQLAEKQRAVLQNGQPVEWCPSGYCYRDEEYSMGKHPLHFAGAYYIQEPSAMLPASMLQAGPGDRVLDLCAAPGGKSTQLIDRMDDCGLLVSNDISASRGRAIVKNLERFGAGRILVTAEEPEKLAAVFPEYFDKILVDAPCSGEGMFRREPSMREEWERKGPEFYALLQRQILSQAVKMLCPGGRLVYSTCTFDRREDEENADWLTEEYPDLRLLESRKLMPHQCRGEGQYAALFEKRGIIPSSRTAGSEDDIRKKPDGAGSAARKGFGNFKEKGNEAVLDFFRLTGVQWNPADWYSKDDQLYDLPVDIRPMKGIRFLRTGLLLGEVKRGRFEPSQALAMYLTGEQFANTVEFDPEDERVVRYLKGETVEAEEAVHRGKDGWCLVLAGGLSLGWAKRSGVTLKNKYEPGWRMQ